MRLICSIVIWIAVIILALCLGDSGLNPGQAVAGLFGVGDAYTNLVVQTLRLPRVLLACVAGAAFGIAGCLLQTLTRNPLASPDVIGLSQMANVGALMFLVLFTSAGGALLFPIYYQPLPAIMGALLAGAILYLFSFRNKVSIHRFILLGIGINALAQSLVTLLILLTNKRAAQAHIFMTGSVHNAAYYQVFMLCVILVALTGFVLYNHRCYDIYKLGRETSLGLGARYQQIAVLTLVIISILMGLTVSFVGGIQFVGLIAPQLAGLLAGTKFYQHVLMSGITGSVIVISSDLLGRTLFLPLEVPAGVFTAAIGAPFFMFLLFRRRQT